MGTKIYKEVEATCTIDIRDIFQFIGRCSESERKQILRSIQEEQMPLEIKTLDDEFKLRIIRQVWDKVTPWELEELLKSKI
jgi:hypothetical protein